MSQSAVVDHRSAVRVHAKRAAWQRFGLAVAVPDLIEAEMAIWGGRAEWLDDQPRMRSAYRVRLKTKPVIVIFDIHLNAIVTVLPHAVWNPRNRAGLRRR